MPNSLAKSGALSEADTRDLSRLASQISSWLGAAFGAGFTALGLWSLVAYLHSLIAPAPYAVWCGMEIAGITLVAAVVFLGFGVPVLWCTLKRQRASKEYLTPLFVFCAVAQTKLCAESAKKHLRLPAEILPPKARISPRQLRRDNLVLEG